MKVDWLMPYDTPNNLIKSYRIELAKAVADTQLEDLIWHEVEESVCGGTGRTTCELDMKFVIAGDYGLKDAGAAYFEEGDEIYARTTAIGRCWTDDTETVRKESASKAYDNTPVKL